MRLAPRPGSSGFKEAPMNAKITQMAMNAPIPRPRHTHTFTSQLPPLAGFLGRGGRAGSAATGMATGRADTGTATGGFDAGIATGRFGAGTVVPQFVQARLAPAAGSAAITVILQFGQVIGVDMRFLRLLWQRCGLYGRQCKPSRPRAL
jgi:hypothetical protein